MCVYVDVCVHVHVHVHVYVCMYEYAHACDLYDRGAFRVYWEMQCCFGVAADVVAAIVVVLMVVVVVAVVVVGVQRESDCSFWRTSQSAHRRGSSRSSSKGSNCGSMSRERERAAFGVQLRLHIAWQQP